MNTYKFDLLFDDKFFEDKVDNIKISELEKANISKWISQVKDGMIDKEKQGYFKFYEMILQGILGYNSDYITHERSAKHTNKPVEVSITEENNPQKVRAVIELKGVGTNLWKSDSTGKTPIEQALLYGLNNKAEMCIVSDYKDFFFFIPQKGSNESYHMNINDMMKDDFYLLKIFKYLLSKDTFLKKETFTKAAEKFIDVQKEFSKKFYKLFHETRKLLVYELEQSNEIDRKDAVYYSQKILDRVIFICFAEDRTPLILDRNFLSERLLNAIREEKDLWNELNLIFTDLNKGVSDALSNDGYKIPRINGGLFHDNLLNQLQLADKRERGFFPKECFEEHKFSLKKYDDELKNYSPIFRNIFLISSFDFESEVNVNILGHIFENSLNDLEQLKEEDISQRKKDGIFYTPEYITDYICRNTIIPYLSENDNNSVDALVNEYSGNSTKIYQLEEKLKKIKILDPACGSGAFLNKAVDVLLEIHLALHEYKEKNGWFKATGKKGLSGVILTKFSAEQEIRKIIQNNIYGVDLNPESVEITKLSLFLKVASRSDPLPSIDDNIQCGNSLITGINLKERPLDLDENIEKLIKLKKQDLNIYKSQKDVINYNYNESLNKYFGENWKEQKPFNWEIEFAEIFKDGGFDVVIGNPPYVRQELFTNIKSLLQDNYQVYTGMGDLYIYFFERGLQVLKENGRFGIIVSQKFSRANFGKELRKYILNNTVFQQYIDKYPNNKVFDDAVVDPCTIILKKSKNNQNSLMLYNYNTKILQKEILEESWGFGSKEILSIKSKIEKLGKKFKNWEDEVYYGLKTGYNDAFVISEELKNELIKKDPKNKSIIKPLLRGRDIGRFNIKFANMYLLFIPWHFPLTNSSEKNLIKISEEKFKIEYRSMYEYLESHKEKLSNRNKAETGKRYSWYCLQRYGSDYWKEFEKEKIVWLELSDKAKFSIDTENHYTLAGTFIMTGPNIRYLLPLLNSKLIEWYFDLICNSSGVGTNQWKKVFLENIPIIDTSDKEKEKIIKLSNKLLELNKQSYPKLNRFQKDILEKYNLEKLNRKLENFYELSFDEFLKEIQKITEIHISSAIDKRNFEDYWRKLFEEEKSEMLDLKKQITETDNEINLMVYKLYDLTEDEIKIVENNS